MKKNNVLIKAAIAGAVTGALTLAPTYASHHSGKDGFEKCTGVAPAGMNDCGAKDHGCMGKAKSDFDPQEWMYVKKGTCKDLQGAMKTAQNHVSSILKKVRQNKL